MSPDEAAASGTPKFQTLSPFEDEDDEVYSVGPDWFGTPKQRVAQLVGCGMAELETALDTYERDIYKGGPEPSAEQFAILRRFIAMLKVAFNPSPDSDLAELGLTDEQAAAAVRFARVIKRLEGESQIRVHGRVSMQFHPAYPIVVDMMRRTPGARRIVGRRGRESRPACNRRTRGSRRVTSRSAGGGGSGDDPDGEPSPAHRGAENHLLHLVAGGRR